MNLTDPISVNARVRASVPAIEQGDRSISYRELDVTINSIAARLASHRAIRSEPVGVCLQDHPLHLAAIFAVLRLGAIVLPMDWRWTAAEQLKIAQRFRPRLVLVEPYRPKSPGLPAVAVDESWQSSSGISEIPRATDADDIPAMLGLSSGTTGEPKAVVTSHSQYAARINTFIVACGLRPDDRYFSALPLVFSAGRIFAMANLISGATVVLCPTLSSPMEIAEGIVSSRADTTCLVPTVSRAMLKTHSGSSHLFPNLRVLMSIGAPLHDTDRAAIRQRLAGNLIDIYGATGASLASVIGPDEQERYPGSVGRAALDVEVQIVDGQDRPVPPNEIGRLRYSGPGMPMGFYGGVSAGDEDLRGGWFYPGDYASINDDGYIFLQGRRSEIVICGGINVFTPEIERALMTLPSVIEAAVVGVPSADSGEEVVAFLRCQGPDSRELMRQCRGILAAYKIPKRFHQVDSIPKNSAGKVLKTELVAMDSRLNPSL